MRILFVGDLNEYTRSFQRYRAMRELGHDVTALSFVPDNTAPGLTPPPGILVRVRHHLGYPADETGINGDLVRAARDIDPQVVWIEKGLMIRPATLAQAKGLCRRVRLVSYTEDDMFARHNQSAYYRGCLRLHDVVFTTKSYNCSSGELPSLGARSVIFVDKAFDRHAHRPMEVDDRDRLRLGGDVGFIGTFEEDRAKKMLFLAEEGIVVRIWGNGWGRWVGRHGNLRVENRPVYGDDYARAICATRINLCFLRKANRDLQTDRTMEIPACGAFMLAERTEEHSRLFEEGKEVAYFDAGDPREMLSRVRHYLANEEERKAIAVAGRVRCLNGGYSHHERLAWMLGVVSSESSAPGETGAM